MLAAGFMVYAQDTRTGTDTTLHTSVNNMNATNNSVDNGSMNSNNTYNAYGANVPLGVQKYFMKDYPSANNVRWQQSNDWWHATYMNNGQSMNTYYNLKGQSFIVALPVLETQVPADVITKVSNMYSGNVYDITRIKGNNDQEEYIVRILDNGQLRIQRLNNDGTASTDNFSSNLNGREFAGPSLQNSDKNSVNSNSDMQGNFTSAMDKDLLNSNDGSDKTKLKISKNDGSKEVIKIKKGKTKSLKNNNSQDE